MNWEEDLVKYRREKAKETLNASLILLKEKQLFSAVNRIYYALFYEVSALLKIENLSSPTHKGVKTLFSQHFIKTGKLEVEIGKFFNKMFEFRQKGDYEDFVYFEEKDVDVWLQIAEKHIGEIENYIINHIEKPVG